METDTERERELLRKHTKEFEVLIEKQLKRSEEEKEGNEALKDLQEEIEDKDNTLNHYLVRDREMNDELQEARKAALEVRTQGAEEGDSCPSRG